MWLHKSLRLLKRKAWLHDESGLSLVESLVSVAIIGLVIVTLVGALSAGTMAVQVANQTVTAQNLAGSQLEQIKADPYIACPSSPYPNLYTVIPVSETGYNVSHVVYQIDTDIQRITVTVYQGVNPLLIIEDLKVNRP